MPKINAFRAIHPLSGNAEAVACTIEEMSLETAKNIRQNNPQSFIHLLVPQLNSALVGDEKKQLAFETIKANLAQFLSNGVLVEDDKPAFYIYRVVENNTAYTGVWTSTSIDDYPSGVIKKHEHLKPERVKQLADYLEKTGIDANPVLITYPSSATVNHLLGTLTQSKPDVEFSKEMATHYLWKIDTSVHCNELQLAFAEIPKAYIADGHHRAEAALTNGLKMRSFNPQFIGDEEFNYFSSVYIAHDLLQLFSFNRLIRGLSNVEVDSFLDRLKDAFTLRGISDSMLDFSENEMGLYIKGNWYKLAMDLKGQQSNLPVSVLHDNILKPLLGIDHPETDERIEYIAGTHPLDTIKQKVDSGEFDMAFILRPIAIEAIMNIADTGQVMPPKSTWFEPKFPVGLIIHQL